MSGPSSRPAPAVLQVCAVPDGGAAEHVLRLSEGLVARGWRVDLCCPPGWLAERAADLGVGVQEVGFVREISPVADARALLAVWRRLRSGRYDLVHVHSSKAGVVGRAAARAARVPAIFTPHAWSFLAAGGRLQRLVWTTIERAAAALSRGGPVICVSEDERRAGAAARVVADGRSEVVVNGVHVPPPAQRERRDGRPVVGTIARLAPQKGIDVLLAAAPSLLQAAPGARVVIVGGGPLEDELRAKADELGLGGAVSFLGPVENARDLLPSFDVFVLPSRWEGMPIALLEARAAGLPCVATEVGGVRDIVADGADGRVVPVEDADALAGALVELASDEELRERWGRIARERVAREFPLDAMVRRTELLYLRTILAPELSHA